MILSEVDGWPSDDLEYLGRCPVCQSRERSPMYEELSDETFRSAPGLWALWTCCSCENAYLDPRPTPDSIHLAYRHYYTHAAAPRESSVYAGVAVGFRSRLAQLIRNDYIFSRLGHELPGGRAFGGRLLLELMATRGEAILHQLRHVPVPPRAGAKLLDVGSGAGAFLEIAQALGYCSEGLEPDPRAAAAARASGFTVTEGSVPGSGLPPERFTHVTLSHVLEHLHDPLAALAEIHSLLEPGGRLWIAQPNLGAVGLSIFGRHWRGLEVPRHLVLWRIPGLLSVLENLGFVRIEVLRPGRFEAETYFRRSLGLREGRSPDDLGSPLGWDAGWSKAARRANILSRADPGRSETMYVQAYRGP